MSFRIPADFDLRRKLHSANSIKIFFLPLFFLSLFTGMAWSFRFATLNKNKMAPIMVLPQHPHLDIGAWLDLLDLRQYDGNSIQNSTNPRRR